MGRKKKVRYGHNEVRVMGLYHSQSRLEFACLTHYAPMTEAPCWKLIHGGTLVPEVEVKMRHITFDSIQDANEWLVDRDFHILNKNIVLCPNEKYEECTNDTFFWDTISRVYGPDTASIVVYDMKKKPYRISALEKLGYWKQDVHWIWYGRDTDPAIEAWLLAQIIDEVAELSMYVAIHDYQEVHENRHVQVSRMAYETYTDEEHGERELLFQFKDGEVIEI